MKNREIWIEVLKQVPMTITALLTGVALIIAEIKNHEKSETIDEKSEVIQLLVDQVKSISQLVDENEYDQP